MKRFFATPQQPDRRIFFLDRNLGKRQLASLLTDAGFVVKVHDDYFRPDELDEVWLAACAQRQWIVITADKRILKDSASMKAIGMNGGIVFFLPQNNKNPQLWAPIIKSAWTQIQRLILTHDAPFVANISPNGVWGLKELNIHGREKKKKKSK